MAAFAVALALFMFEGCQVRHEPEEPSATILSTDLSLCMDPDDWFDTWLFLKSEHLSPAGIVLADYTTDSVAVLTKELAMIAGKPDIPVVKGVQGKLRREGDSLAAPDFHEGAEFILETMRNARGKVRLIALGSLRNEALAYSMDPDLFRRKAERVVFVSVPVHGEFATNLERDTLAASTIYNSGVSVMSIPALKQKLTGPMEERVARTDTPVCRFLTERLRVWREWKTANEQGFLERTQQLMGMGKNLWSLPVFIPENEWDDYGIVCYPCNGATDPVMRAKYPYDPDGKDLMMVQWNEKAVLKHALDIILEK